MGNRGARYSSDLARAQFCLVPPGGDGWSSRVDDAVRQACKPQAIKPQACKPQACNPQVRQACKTQACNPQVRQACNP